MFATDTSDLVIDTNGYFAAPGTGGLHFYGIAPCRVLDTRTTLSNQPFKGVLFVQIGGTCNVLIDASAGS